MRGFGIAYEGAPTERSRELWVQEEVDFAALARGMGALGIRVQEPDAFAPAFEQALAAGCPAVIDVVTDIAATAPLAWTDEARA
jgi:acetolactate synthase-1/2/3 large subunit